MTFCASAYAWDLAQPAWECCWQPVAKQLNQPKTQLVVTQQLSPPRKASSTSRQVTPGRGPRVRLPNQATKSKSALGTRGMPFSLSGSCNSTNCLCNATPTSPSKQKTPPGANIAKSTRQPQRVMRCQTSSTPSSHGRKKPFAVACTLPWMTTSPKRKTSTSQISPNHRWFRTSTTANFGVSRTMRVRVTCTTTKICLMPPVKPIPMIHGISRS